VRDAGRRFIDRVFTIGLIYKMDGTVKKYVRIVMATNTLSYEICKDDTTH
jgi:hypothetical protein